MSTDPAQQSRKVLVNSLVASGAVLIAAGIFVGLWQGPVFFLIAGVGLIDLALAWAFASGKLGLSGANVVQASEQPATGPDVAAHEATDDPSYNPYARED